MSKVHEWTNLVRIPKEIPITLKYSIRNQVSFAFEEIRILLGSIAEEI